MNDVAQRHPKVFIAYAQDSQGHKDAVRGLADLLRSCGVDAEIDQYAEDQRRDWNGWAHGHFTASDFVVVVASPRMKAVADGTASAEENRGVQAEMTVLRDFLHRDRPTWTKKILPVVLPGGTVDGLPDFLGPYSLSHYRVEELSVDGIGTLLRIITSQPRVVRPPLGQLPELPPEPAPAIPLVEPEWRVLPAAAPVVWRREIMREGNRWVPDWSETMELHLAPVDDAARLTAGRLRAIGARFPSVMRDHGLVPETVGVQARQSERVAEVSHYDSRTGTGVGLAVLRSGQRSAWWTLPSARIGRVLIRDEAVADVAAMLRVLVALDATLPDRFAPAIGVDPTDLLRIGTRDDLTSDRASMPMSGTTSIKVGAEESLTGQELSHSAAAVAEELIERVIARFPQR